MSCWSYIVIWYQHRQPPQLVRVYVCSSQPLPSPREVSLVVHSNVDVPHSHLVSLFPIWAQFIAHDISLTPQMTGEETKTKHAGHSIIMIQAEIHKSLITYSKMSCSNYSNFPLVHKWKVVSNYCKVLRCCKLIPTFLLGFNGERLKCCGIDFNDFHPECFPIRLPDNDPVFAATRKRCQEYTRSASTPRTGCTLGEYEETLQPIIIQETYF